MHGPYPKIPVRAAFTIVASHMWVVLNQRLVAHKDLFFRIECGQSGLQRQQYIPRIPQDCRPGHFVQVPMYIMLVNRIMAVQFTAFDIYPMQ
jgi:hypothetical protein